METPMKALRTALGMNQTEFAATIDCDPSLISHAEKGKPLGGHTTRAIFDLYREECSRQGLIAEDFLRGCRGTPEKRASGDPPASGKAA